ncbi:MAG: EcsC family protein [Betaproteobacteria bacterium]
MPLTDNDLAALTEAKRLLENPGIAAKLTNVLGKPIEKGFALLPDNWRERISIMTRDALLLALKAALASMDRKTTVAHPGWHKFAATLSGAAGGAFGLPALAIELPISTAIMSRSIADIARANGEDLTLSPARLACVEVFALGGGAKGVDAAETGYFAVRAAVARAVSEATEYLTVKAVIEEGAPAIARLVAVVASRFQVQVSEKAAAMSIPLIGAVGGATINYLFIDHFQDMSRGHFTIRRLERIYGVEEVRAAYELI